MIASQLVRRYALNQQIAPEVADQEIVLHYALKLLNEQGLVGRLPDGSPGPLLFKGGTALRKCWFGSGGRFSGTVAYTHEAGSGRFELQISYRLHPVLNSRDLILLDQEYLSRVEFLSPVLHGLDPYEMIGEKIMATNRRQGGSAKDVYDLFLWSAKVFDIALVRRVAVLKAWTDQRPHPRYDPAALLEILEPRNFRWEDLNGLVPRNQHQQRELICHQVRERFAALAEPDETEQQMLDDQLAHREHRLYDQAVAEAQALAATGRPTRLRPAAGGCRIPRVIARTLSGQIRRISTSHSDVM